LLDKICHALSDKASEEEIDNLNKEVERMLKMFYLDMKVKGLLKPTKDDYFV
jgi:hypothetical protein